MVVLTVLVNLGKMFPVFCYRRQASWKERLALAIGLWPRTFAFILSQALLLSFRFSRALSNVEMQSKELKGTLESYKTEIIQRVHAEEALRESEEKYRTILHSIEEGYYEVDLAGNMTFFNDSLCKMVGYPKDELMGMNNRQYMSEETAKKFYETFSEVYRTGKPTKSVQAFPLF